MSARVAGTASLRALGPATVTIALLGAVIGGVGAPLITSVAIDLDVPLVAAQWTLTIALFSGAVSAPILGRLGTGPHRRRTILVTLSFVAAGGLLTTIPLPFWLLLVGRALQGLGLGATALLMSVARDHLPAAQAQSTIATVSVAGTVGIGVAYPLMGFLDQWAGLRVAYGVGFLLSLSAVLIAWYALPTDRSRPSQRIDVAGAALLSVGILGLLIAVAQPAAWDTPLVGVAVLAITVLILIAWARHELLTTSPLVDLRLLMASGVLRANTAMFTAGIAMYLLFSLLTRYVQTPSGADYGFGLSGVLAGAALIPFSVLGFVAGRLSGGMSRKFTGRWTFVINAVIVTLAAGLFAIATDSLIATLASMAILGFGVGGASAIMPTLVLNGVPREETSSVLSINQIVRTIGFSIGSALAGLVLATATPSTEVLPSEHGYALAALCTIPLIAISCASILAPRRK